MSEITVSLQGLTLAYKDTVAVPSLDLDIHNGELVTLLGPSGCGKSTTMRAIAGLMQPRSGKIIVDGRDVTRVPANKRQIGLVFQSYALFPHLSGFENVAFGLRLKRTGSKEVQQRVQSALDTVGLSEYAARKPAELSGGQQQRLALARALVMKPKVLLLDEPLSNLDARLRLELRTELQRLQRDTGITMVFVTHDQAEALALSDRIVLMNKGRVEQVGTPSQLYNEPQSVFAADFVGFENIFSTATGVPGQTQISGPGGTLELGYEVNATHLAWRPGAIKVGQGSFTGCVKGVAFAGERREYVFDSSLGTIKADAPVSDDAYNIGDNLQFNLPMDSVRLLRETQ